ncbi:MAG: ABC transporter ATP-binding protein [Deltaproteobacteria bacterium]|nr:MAG: ABC transporter ATP-binding protein [Deltaproteobacteria bacterium]
MLLIEDLKVKIGDKVILSHIDLKIPEGVTCVLFGPNGSGKTSLLMTIMGFSQYKVVGGRIIFDGKDITNLPTYERARLGIGISFQRPPAINGLKLKDMIKICGANDDSLAEKMARKLNLEKFLNRDVNVGFSGGEIKRSELLQLMAQSPKMLLIDEPESGVDLENISLVGETIETLIKGNDHYELPRKVIKRERKRSGLIITHTGYILDYITADMGAVLYNGAIACQGNPIEILKWIKGKGYKECSRCVA